MTRGRGGSGAEVSVNHLYNEEYDGTVQRHNSNISRKTFHLCEWLIISSK